MGAKFSKKDIEELEAAAKTGNLPGIATKLKVSVELIENTQLHIAVTGESGSGKSSFVNAIRGLGDEDEGAAETGVVETTMEPNAYPVLPNVTIWDLPGIGTPNFQPDEYLKEVKFNSYDFFIIIASERFTSHHTSLAQEIQKMGKRFYYVRSKVDNDLNAGKRKKNFNKERLLQEIREDCIENLREGGEASPRVFLLCSWEPHKYDFQLLQETLERELDAHKGLAFILARPDISEKIVKKNKVKPLKHRSKCAPVSSAVAADPDPDLQLKPSDPLPATYTPMFSKEDSEELEAAARAGNLPEIAAKLKKSLESSENTPLHIAVTGNSGSGKSSFVNAILGLGDEDEGAAETGVVETTMEPKAYPHPVLPNVTMWDLPGIGTPNFQPDKYLKQVKFNNFDFFIIIASERFTSHHTSLAQEIHKMGKRFYYVRSKVDADLYAAQIRRPSTYNEEQILQVIRENCIKNLREAGEASPRVFLISSWELLKYDFHFLQETLERELDAHKRLTFILALPNISAKILEKKKAKLQKQIWKLALVSSAAAAIPLPGLGLACDIIILVTSMRRYCKAFGLDTTSLTNLANRVGTTVPELRAVIKSPLAAEISKELVIKLLSKAACGAAMAAETALSFIPVPVVGSLLAAGVSFGTTYYMLQSFLNEAAEDAQKVLSKALEDEKFK
ncbi:interferon-inducible GTPase 5-like [Chrysemys picta bellii]|uniref:interferon-inducible GTPase 5-like n=1 Tax=Chrysemys picta bellii TaxID=8478 RepID=UPI0032B21C62